MKFVQRILFAVFAIYIFSLDSRLKAQNSDRDFPNKFEYPLL